MEKTKMKMSADEKAFREALGDAVAAIADFLEKYRVRNGAEEVSLDVGAVGGSDRVRVMFFVDNNEISETFDNVREELFLSLVEPRKLKLQ